MSPMNEQHPDPRKNARRAQWAVATLAVIGIAAAVYQAGLDTEVTEDAYVRGNLVQVTSQVSGTVTAIEVDDTDKVEPGQRLIALSDVDQALGLERAKAALATAVRNARAQYLHVKELESQTSSRASDYQKASADFQRRSQLADAGAISREELSHARQALETARAGLSAAQQALAQSQALVEGTRLRSHPLVMTAASEVRDAFVALHRTRIGSPVSGYVTSRNVQVGQRISPGVSLMSVVPLDQVWVDANFKESQLKNIRIGQQVLLTSDVYGSQVTYRGRVVGVDAGTGNAFALLPAQNATGNWIKVTQRVPVRIELEPSALNEHPLRVGLSMKVAIQTHDRSGLVLREDVAALSASRTTIFDQELQDADQLVEEIVQANAGQPAMARQ
ncbi:HlyD family efflux transporter periplasmic adaptor subunit [Pseudomonas sp. MC042]|uniref:HlyD family efflux transporter periplasmic adaptor subunit n=2 Tax=Pseudomonas piscis TaxID=2614538 RepID=A0A7X1PLE3_9PSED|nr:HlyD family efflux transporter periplasmic adaptor subunit [Pseudomonas piscis]